MAVWDIKERNDLVRANDLTVPTSSQRGIFYGGDVNTPISNIIDVVQISTAGNAVDFGDTTVARSDIGTAANSIRGLGGGGRSPSGTHDQIEFITITSNGNATDFGNLSVTREDMSGGVTSDHTRALFCGGQTPALFNIVDYTNFTSTGNASDFGNLSVARRSSASCSSPTRFLVAGGSGGSPAADVDVIDIGTIQTLGNSVDFGDLSASRRVLGGACNGVKAVFAGGVSSNVIDIVTVVSAGDAADFGDATASDTLHGGLSGGDRALYAGFARGTGGTINAIQMSTAGNATDFGDLSVARHNVGALSNAHGGLNFEAFGSQRPSVNYMPGSGRGLLGGGKTNPAGTNQNAIQMIHIQTLGNTSDFGNLTLASYGRSGCASRTRGVFGGGYKDASPAGEIDTIESIEFASQGNAADFGNSTVARAFSASTAGNQTRGIIGAGGNAPGLVDVIDYITIASAGNAADFGNLSAARSQFSGSSSPTRAIFYGGLE